MLLMVSRTRGGWAGVGWCGFPSPLVVVSGGRARSTAIALSSPAYGSEGSRNHARTGRRCTAAGAGPSRRPRAAIAYTRRSVRRRCRRRAAQAAAWSNRPSSALRCRRQATNSANAAPRPAITVSTIRLVSWPGELSSSAPICQGQSPRSSRANSVHTPPQRPPAR